MRRIAVYPGTFDPVTYGHLDLVDRARNQFDKLIISILRNTKKEPLFSAQDRIGFLKGAIAEWDNVEVDTFDGLLVDYCAKVGAAVILRGVRAVSDFEYEMQMAMMNRKLQPQIETFFLMPSEAYSYLSSELVREIARLGGSISALVPAPVAEAAHKRFKASC